MEKKDPKEPAGQDLEENNLEENGGAPDKSGLKRFHRGVFIVPSLVTSAAFFCGFYTIIASINGEFYKAAWAIILAMIFDGLDGRIARAMGATSDFGVEFDSLSDLMAFGLAPAILMYNWILQPYGRVGWMAVFLFALCGALRLARFNIQQTNTRTDHFVGIPIPAAAGLLATTVLLSHGPLEGMEVPGELVLFVVYGLALLMVSNIPYRNFKYIDRKKRSTFKIFLWVVLFLFVVALFPHYMLFAMGVTYMLHGPVEWLIAWFRKIGSSQEQADDPAPPTAE